MMFTPDRGHLTLEARRTGDCITVSVPDTGVGIEARDARSERALPSGTDNNFGGNCHDRNHHV
jgi:signal transduction histidine kinase